MSELLNAVLDAHGGLERWRRFSQVRASIVSGGELWGIKGLMQDPAPRQMAVALHHCPTIRVGGPQNGLHPRPDRHREPGRPRRPGASQPAGIVCGARADHTLGRAAPLVLQRLCALDLPHHPLPPGAAGLLGLGHRADRGERREVGRATGALPVRDRQSQHPAGILLRRGPSATPSRLPRRRSRRIRSRSVHL
ncbi:MAG: hypothetical protein QOG10_5909 [Kribbellaceae bacterium]|nr:hypothetical protein [Kribbellaceae bacterium]